jgi:gas vesicle protein
MKTKKIAFLIGSMVVLVLGAGAPAQGAPQAGSQAEGKASADMMAMCKSMMADRQQLMEEMKASDERLNQLVQKMNAASGQAKVDATAATVAELVAQRSHMRERMMRMHEGMMGHMMQHSQAGPKSMAACPMMKMGGMGGMKH